MRLIDADALMATLGITDMDCEKCAWCDREWNNCKRGGDFEDACCAIENAPTIEPQRQSGRKVYQAGYAEGYKAGRKERKTGKWIHVTGYCTPGGDPVWACSECGKGEHVYGIEYQTYSHNVSDGQWVACPNCGARMEA